MSLKSLLDARWSVRVGKREDGAYVADAVPMDENWDEDWTRYVEASDRESPENALIILASKAFDQVIPYPS